jgi:hypothetical protein
LTEEQQKMRRSTMRKRVLVGIGAGLVAAALVVGVVTAAYKAGRARDGEAVVVRDGETVRVVDHHWGRGPGVGFLVLPLLVAGLVVLVASRWGHHAPGWGWAPGPEAALAEWHRRAHEQQGSAAPSPPTDPDPPSRSPAA